MAMTRNGNLSAVVLILFVSLWLFMLITSLQVFCIAIKTTKTVAPTRQGSTKQEQRQQQENVQKLHFGIKKQIERVG